MKNTILRRDLLAGLLFLAIGAGAVYVGRDYGMGAVQNMGPGFIPVSLGLMLMVLGLVNCLMAVRNLGSGETVESVPIVAIVLITAAVIIFGLLVERTGLLIASGAVVIISSLASRLPLWKIMVSLVVLLTIAACLFVFGMGQPFQFLLPR